jgi:hypothetical protein
MVGIILGNLNTIKEFQLHWVLTMCLTMKFYHGAILVAYHMIKIIAWHPKKFFNKSVRLKRMDLVT